MKWGEKCPLVQSQEHEICDSMTHVIQGTPRSPRVHFHSFRWQGGYAKGNTQRTKGFPMNSLSINAFVTKRTEKLTVEALTGPEGGGRGEGIGKEDSFFSCSARGQPSILRTQKAGSWPYGSVVCPGVAPHLV